MTLVEVIIGITILSLIATMSFTKINLSNYKFSDKLSIKMNKFIDFSIFTKYRDVWFVWVRVVVYILLVLYWINETSKFFRGFSISSYSTSNVNQNTQTGGNDK